MNKDECKGNCKNFAIVTVPEIVNVDEIRDEAPGVKTFYMSFENPEIGEKFKIKSGQFIMCTVFGSGEFAVSLPPSPENDRFHITVRGAGRVTNALHKIKVGDKLGVRGPFGNGFPFDDIKGKNIIYVAGGIGIIPLRSSVVHVMQHRADFGRVILLYGSRSPVEILYQENIAAWQKAGVIETFISIDRAVPGWTGEVGFVNSLIARADVPVDNTVAFVCGPPVMFNSVIKDLMERGLPEDNIISTLERHMKCGIGKCQHCAIGRTLVCTDGPVYTYRQIKTLGEEI
jgi:NAD(P)H-flavin reductase